MWLDGVAVGVREAQRTARHPSWRLLGALGYPGFDIAVLWVAFSAVGSPPPLPWLVLGYSIGYLVNTLPIPGGIGVLDAGLSGALVLYGARPGHVIAAVLVYHTIAFWIPSLGGLIAYARLRPRLTDPRGDDPPSSSLLADTRFTRRSVMNAARLILKPTAHGWAVGLTDGRELARFRGPGSRWRALRYLARATNALRTPALARKGNAPPTGATRWR